MIGDPPKREHIVIYALLIVAVTGLGGRRGVQLRFAGDLRPALRASESRRAALGANVARPRFPPKGCRGHGGPVR